ncbi:MAG TPA: adenylate/guanylate cyclase domain-containing protein, partial [Xanthobacteraceae bacterium]
MRQLSFVVTDKFPDIAAWLQGLGMSEYAERFAANRIDFSVLSELTDADLKELGIVLGDRRRLLRAIGELERNSPAPSSITGAAERRQLTVIFCDLVGSTSLSAQLDPEDLREVIGAYHRCCATTVEQHAGFVAKYMGDGVLIYFGYPQAHEHDAERAVRTALALVDGVSKLSAPDGSQLRVRIGIATGLVVVGDLLGSGESQERGIVGDTPNLAARLQGIAGPGTVVIADGVRRLIGDLFELQDLGEQSLKGIPDPVQAWSVSRANPVESRFDALRGSSAVGLVGRKTEFDLLVAEWNAAKRSEGRTLLLSGEAGIGKSRLTSAFLQSIADESYCRLRYFCSPQHANSALYPFIGQLERAAGLSHGEAASAILDRFDAFLAASAPSSEQAALLADLLSLPNDGRYPALGLTGLQRRQKTLEAIVNHILALTRSDPVLMIFEDAHWSDPSSQEVLKLAIQRLAAHPVLLIVTFRPEFAPAWTGPSVTTMALDRLLVGDVDTMIERVAGARELPDTIRQEIVARCDGVPLFIEEMTKAVLEANSERDVRRTVAAVPELAVPASLHASLMARLDRLGAAKEVAQIAAAIGREFSHRMLDSVARKPAGELAAALDRLLEAGLLFRQGLPPDATYLFNHALVQDAAYGTLLRDTRRALHARIADSLEQQFSDVAERQPEVVARHLSEAGLVEKATALWAKAGRRALARSALNEAAEQLARAQSMLSSLPPTAERQREQIKLQIELSNALIHTKGHASSETKASFEKARALIADAEMRGEAADDPLLLFSVLYGFWVANRMAFQGAVACELAQQFLDLAEQQSAAAPRMIGHMMLGISLVLVGAASEGRPHLDQAIALYDPASHRALATRFGHDVRMTAYCWRALALWLLGYPDGAATDMERALADADEIEHAATSMFALSHVSLAHTFRRDYAKAEELAGRLVALGDAKGSRYWKSYGMMLQGWAFTQGGHAAEAIAVGTAAAAAMRSTGATAYVPWYMSYLATAYAKLGRFDDAWRCIAEAINAADATGERWCDAEVYRTAADIALAAPAPDQGKIDAYLNRALSASREQKAASLELRTATSLARLRQKQGRLTEGWNLVAPVLGWFTEGFDTPDLIEAQSLLQSLSSAS